MTLCFHEGSVSYWSRENVFVSGIERAVKPENLYRTEEAAFEVEKKLNEEEK